VHTLATGRVSVRHRGSGKRARVTHGSARGGHACEGAFAGGLHAAPPPPRSTATRPSPRLRPRRYTYRRETESLACGSSSRVCQISVYAVPGPAVSAMPNRARPGEGAIDSNVYTPCMLHSLRSRAQNTTRKARPKTLLQPGHEPCTFCPMLHFCGRQRHVALTVVVLLDCTHYATYHVVKAAVERLAL
jgi:hypothetical protein